MELRALTMRYLATLLAAILGLTGCLACYAQDIEPPKRSVSDCVQYVRQQVPGSQFDAYVSAADPSEVHTLSKSQQEVFYFDKCMEFRKELELKSFKEKRSKILKATGTDICNVPKFNEMPPEACQ